MSRRRRALRWLVRGALAWCAVCLAFFVYVYAVPFPKELLSRGAIQSLEIVDREGRSLREVLSTEEGRLQWKKPGDVSPYLIEATIAAEDARFRSHPGVDPVAVARAMWQNLTHRRRVSGASTMTMQVIRLMRPRPRTLRVKLSESVLALRLERLLGKEQILEEYINRAPYGNQLFGAEAASQMYFRKPAKDLSLSEAAFLAGIPQNPSRLNPYRNLDGAMARRNWILERMRSCGKITADDLTHALSEPVQLHPRRWAFRAPHFADYVLSACVHGTTPGRTRIATTLDLLLQEKVQGIVREQIKSLRALGLRNGAAVVLHNPTGEIRAMVGAGDFFDEVNLGQNNGALAPRPPGSTVKALTYTLAFEKGMTPADIVADLPTHFETPHGDYCPENYDGRCYGPMRLRSALANSLNICAVKVLSKVGVETLYQRMREMGFSHLSKEAPYYGLGLTLGSAEVTLLELCNGFATIARLGVWRPVVALKGTSSPRGKRILDPISCFQTADILSDGRARILSFGEHTPLNLPFRVAAKTGTSPNFRDNWTVGFTPEYTVGVWMGDFKNNPMQGVSGITGAGPIFHAIMMAVYETETPTWYTDPPGVVRRNVCALSGMKPGPGCPSTVNEVFRAGSEPRCACSFHRRIRLDRETGLLATERCPRGETIERTFVCLPPEYETWARGKGIAVPPSRACPHGAIAPFADSAGAIRIVHPNPWDVFIMDPSIPAEYQTVSLQAIAPTGTDGLTWFVNGQPLPAAAERTARWQLCRGEHVIVARDSHGRSSSPVRIRVE